MNNGQNGSRKRKTEVITFHPDDTAAKDFPPKLWGSSGFIGYSVLP